MIVTLEPGHHNGEACFAFRFKYDNALKEYIKRFPGVAYSKKLGCYFIMNQLKSVEKFKQYLTAGGYTYYIKNTIVPKTEEQKHLPALGPKKIIAHQKYLDFLAGKRYSTSTQKVYGGFVRDFLRFTKTKELNALDSNDVRLFIEWTVGNMSYSTSTHRQLVSALRLFSVFYPRL